ncbi:hypothetical protein LUZ60_006765 [Juncus effusus]|nr:hypothetical protein LUZ60_006765 [Juncus effusus]
MKSEVFAQDFDFEEGKRGKESMRGRSYSYSPSPPPARGYGGRRGRSPSPPARGGRYAGGGGGGRSRDRDLPTSLLVRNLRRDCRPDELRRPFGQFGRLKDIYLPRDYYTGEPRGFGFIQYFDPRDAAEAKYQMDGQIFLGREITVVFAEENRKKPQEMRQREKPSSRSRSRYSRSRSPVRRRYSRGRSRSPSRSRSYYSPSPRRNDYSRSPTPDRDGKYEKRRERSYSRSPIGSRSRSPIDDDNYPINNNNNIKNGGDIDDVKEESRSPSASPVRAVRGRSPSYSE